MDPQRIWKMKYEVSLSYHGTFTICANVGMDMDFSSGLYLGSKESACSAGDSGDMVSIPGLGRSPEEKHGNPLQYSCLENPMGRGAWWLQSIGSQRGGHDWNYLAHTHMCIKVNYRLSLLTKFLKFCLFIPYLVEAKNHNGIPVIVKCIFFTTCLFLKMLGAYLVWL